MTKPKIPCPTCNGKGTVLLDDTMFRTLQTLREIKKGSAADVWRELPDKLGATAICNRLNKLFVLGCVIRKRNGKAWEYSAK